MRTIEVYGTTNCGACIKLEKALERMEITYTKSVNPDNSITGYPTTILCDDKKEIERIEGFSPKRLNNIVRFLNEQ